MRKPLQDGATAESVEKVTWGSGDLLVRKAPPPSEGGADAEGSSPGAAAGSKYRAPGPLSRSKSSASVGEPPAEEPPKEEGGAALLSRLLSRKGPDLTAPAATSHSILGSGLGGSSFSMLGGDDIFSYLKTDPVSLPEMPSLSSAVPADITGDVADPPPEAPAGRARKGKRTGDDETPGGGDAPSDPPATAKTGRGKRQKKE